MGKDGEEGFRNQEKQGKHKWCKAIHHYGQQRKQADAFLWGVLACLPHIIRHKLQKMTADSSILSRNADGPKSE